MGGIDWEQGSLEEADTKTSFYTWMAAARINDTRATTCHSNLTAEQYD